MPGTFRASEGTGLSATPGRAPPGAGLSAGAGAPGLTVGAGAGSSDDERSQSLPVEAGGRFGASSALATAAIAVPPTPATTAAETSTIVRIRAIS
ncbi:hypothetical protein [Actinoplanes sp. NBRC 103695]|uniref:hypothetical protein n=1 Tax=Actinoplanes sp. NBRC 103695 TaxID=3032202 RepID=UPI0024A34E3D|nr:hypothetical protein [Actinoplanes sp. NBRC 103695]GLY93591.1 hypothetical protein Acsp02_08470 [Actinoplanes sp. NBRC 103695]